jgi:hypothetical protein
MRISLTLVLGLLACGSGSPRPGPGGISKDLVGVWDAEFKRDGDATSPALGQIALFSSPKLRAHFAISAPNVLEGAYDVDYSEWGFDTRSPSELSQANARLVSTDSIEIILNPRVSGGSIVLRGVLANGNAIGTWYRETPAGPRGTFKLVRH